MFILTPTTQFKKDVRILEKQSSKNSTLIKEFLNELEKEGVVGIDKKYLPHKLKGKYKGNWEAHIKPDLLIIWFEIRADNEILLVRAGSHSELLNL